MFSKISAKVVPMGRKLNNGPVEKKKSQKPPVSIVSCFETDAKLTFTIKKHENRLLETNYFKDRSKALFRFVKSTAANIGSNFFILKSLALNNSNRITKPCLLAMVTASFAS